MKYAMGMMTVNRAPKPNYIDQTMTSLKASDILPKVPLVISDSGSKDTSFLDPYMKEPNVKVVGYSEKLTLNKNFARTLTLAADMTDEYVIFIEDDIIVSSKILSHIDTFIHKYNKQFIWSMHAAFNSITVNHGKGKDVWYMLAKDFYGTLCFTIRKQDAYSLAKFIAQVRNPKGADVNIHRWLATYKHSHTIACSVPCRVQHIGEKSSISSPGFIRNPCFKD